MENAKDKNGLKLNILYIACGIILCLLTLIPFFVMGDESIITYNDQLDGELITYILNAKHLFEHLNVYPELMNGIPVAGMMSPAPAFVLLFKIFTPFKAFMWMLVITKISAFLSVYLLTKKVTNKNWIGLIVGLAFMMTPYYPVYGLCISGQAFVWYAVFVFLDKESSKAEIIAAYILTAFYAFTSSLALVGFGIIVSIAIVSIICIFKKRDALIKLLGAEGILILIYALTNIPLITQLIKGSSFVSHKSEIVIAKRSLFDVLKIYLLGGDYYTPFCQKIILPFALIIIAICAVLYFARGKKELKESVESLSAKWKNILAVVCFIAIALVMILLYNLPFVVDIRNNSSGVLHDFSFERISWMLPVAWVLLLAEVIDLLYVTLVNKSDKKWIKVFASGIGTLVCFAIFIVLAYKSDNKTTFMRMIKGSEYKQVSFSQYFSEDLFKQVDELIGRDKSDYRVISLGLYPSSAAYNGFYCLDAYSNNYDVNYKHEFRQIMSDELAKSDYYRAYYDEWGNRCYIYLASYKTGINANFYNIVFDNISLDLSAAKNMGAEYVISASPIINEEALGLTLLNDTPITSDDAWYDLYVYYIK